jgi:hypothetical protein
MTWRHEIEQNPDIRFGFYLRPSFEISQAQAMMHDLLRRQFGLQVGGVFMPHGTIKGFFRSDASVAEIEAACDRAVAGFAAIPVVNNGVIAFGRSGLALNVHQDEFGERNEALFRFHTAVMDQIEPLVHPDCDFSPREWAREKFFAHLTLVMADLPDFAFEEILEFVRQAEPLGPPRFMAEYFHLYAFHSDDWSGNWWDTLEWTFLRNWRLPAVPADVPADQTRVSRGWRAISFTEP